MNEHAVHPAGPHHAALIVDESQMLPAGAAPLPDGGWVVLRDYRTMDGADCRAVLSVIASGRVGENSVRMRVAILERLITNWSYDNLPLPATEHLLDRMPAPVYMALLTMVKPAYDMINGTSVQPTLSRESLHDPASPTPGSSE